MSDFIMMAEEIRLRQLKPRRILISIVTVALVLVVGFLAGVLTLRGQ